MGLHELRRVTDLFIEGTEVVVRDGDDPVLIWVNKLNSFEAEEARRDGAAARSRLVLALEQIGTPEYAIVQAQLVEMGPDAIKEQLVLAQGNQQFLKALESLQNDPDWRERLEISTRPGDLTAPEQALLDQLNADYSNELNARIEVLASEERHELDLLNTEELHEKYKRVWLENKGIASFNREYTKSQLFFALRVCRASKRLQMGGWDHGECEGHRERALSQREEVLQLPDGLLSRLTETLAELSLAPRDARFSDALASSSASSAQPSEGEASTPSTPAETSPAPAATLSSPS